MTQPIEPLVRSEPPPDDAVVVVRGGPLTPQEARDPARISVGAIVITADEEDPVFARVEAITSHGGGPQVVHLELVPGDPLDYADALRRSRLLLT